MSESTTNTLIATAGAIVAALITARLTIRGRNSDAQASAAAKPPPGVPATFEDALADLMRREAEVSRIEEKSGRTMVRFALVFGTLLTFFALLLFVIMEIDLHEAEQAISREVMGSPVRVLMEIRAEQRKYWTYAISLAVVGGGLGLMYHARATQHRRIQELGDGLRSEIWHARSLMPRDQARRSVLELPAPRRRRAKSEATNEEPADTTAKPTGTDESESDYSAG